MRRVPDGIALVTASQYPDRASKTRKAMALIGAAAVAVAPALSAMWMREGYIYYRRSGLMESAPLSAAADWFPEFTVVIGVLGAYLAWKLRSSRSAGGASFALLVAPTLSAVVLGFIACRFPELSFNRERLNLSFVLAVEAKARADAFALALVPAAVLCSAMSVFAGGWRRDAAPALRWMRAQVLVALPVALAALGIVEGYRRWNDEGPLAFGGRVHDAMACLVLSALIASALALVTAVRRGAPDRPGAFLLALILLLSGPVPLAGIVITQRSLARDTSHAAALRHIDYPVVEVGTWQPCTGDLDEADAPLPASCDVFLLAIGGLLRISNTDVEIGRGWRWSPIRSSDQLVPTLRRALERSSRLHCPFYPGQEPAGWHYTRVVIEMDRRTSSAVLGRMVRAIANAGYDTIRFTVRLRVRGAQPAAAFTRALFPAFDERSMPTVEVPVFTTHALDRTACRELQQELMPGRSSEATSPRAPDADDAGSHPIDRCGIPSPAPLVTVDDATRLETLVTQAAQHPDRSFVLATVEP